MILNSSPECYIKSKYLNRWERRSLTVNSDLLQIGRPGIPGQNKSFLLKEISLIKQIKQNLDEICLKTPIRDYWIRKDANSQKLFYHISLYKLYKNYPAIDQRKIKPPEKINYFAPVIHEISKEDSKEECLKLTKDDTFQQIKQVSYIKERDWKKVVKQGGLQFINPEIKANQKKILGYVVKKFLQTGSVLSFSIPTFIMKAQSMLMTCCRSMGAAPVLFKSKQDPLSRMKAFNAFIISFSCLFVDMLKPFNPVIGQTFQATLGSARVFAEQTSHHPPISSIFIEDQDYKIHASLQLQANLSLNSATGCFLGDVCVEFNDGYMIKGCIPTGKLSGLVFGMDHFGPIGAVYSYDIVHHLISSYQIVEKDIFRGYIGQLQPQFYDNFYEKVRTDSSRFYNFKHFPQKYIKKKLVTIEAIWSEGMKYDSQFYFEYSDQNNLPYDIVVDNIQNKLPSDSTFREDIQFMTEENIQKAQVVKQIIEETERSFRKLRQNHKKSRKQK